MTSTMQERTEEQAETVRRLEILSNGRWTVDAGALDVDEHQGCANDTDHGLGTCYVRPIRRSADVDMPDLDGVCPNCALNYLASELRDGDWVCVDVTL